MIHIFEASLVNDILNEVDLIKEHRACVQQHERGEHCPDREQFNLMEKSGFLLSYVVRFEGQIVGYCMVQVCHSLHVSGSIRAIVDNIFVKPEHRGHAGAKFVAFVSECLLSFGVTDLYHLVPVAFNWGAVLKRQGFTHVEDVWHKGL